MREVFYVLQYPSPYGTWDGDYIGGKEVMAYPSYETCRSLDYAMKFATREEAEWVRTAVSTPLFIVKIIRGIR